MWRRLGLFLVLSSICFTSPAAHSFKPERTQWVDSVYAVLTLEQRIGQLIISNPSTPELFNSLNSSNVALGGVSLPWGNVNEVFGSLYDMRSRQDVPLLSYFSQSENFQSFFPGVVPYPSYVTKCAAFGLETLKAQQKSEVALLNRLGINLVADVNFNLQVLHGEFFVNERSGVASSINESMFGLKTEVFREGNILRSMDMSLSLFDYDFLKHIPDSQYESETWLHLRRHIDVLFVNELDLKSGWSVKKFERDVAKGFLKNKLGYQGLLAADLDRVARLIHGQVEYHSVAVDMINAGFDLVLSSDPVATHKNLLYAYKMRQIKPNELEQKVKDILSVKYDLVDWENRDAVVTVDYHSVFNAPENDHLNYETYAHSLTLLKNKNDQVPFKALETHNFASLMVGDDELSTFQKTLDKYTTFTHFVLPAYDITPENFPELIKKLAAFDHVVVGVHAPFSERIVDLLADLDGRTHLVTTVFDGQLPEGIESINGALIVSYENNEYTQQLAPQMIFGARPFSGVYPLDHQDYSGEGIPTESLGRLAYAKPYKAQIDEASLARIDAIAHEAILVGATPGCQVLVAKNGNIVYEKSFGAYTYENGYPVTDRTVYDVASITKVAATTQAVMFLAEQGVLNLDEKLSTYLPELASTNKGDLIIRDVLTHQAGLLAFLPLWSQTLNVEEIEAPYYSEQLDEEYRNEVAYGMYSNLALRDSLYSWTIKSPLRKKPRYRRHAPYDYKYSDLGFYLMYALAERLLNQPMDEFLEQNLYEPLGMSYTAFNPLCKFDIYNITPTEDDKFFRNVLVWGNVHDQVAAMNGGVSGHAGLFSNSTDLAKLGQMHLQGGMYGGYRFFAPESIRQFTASHSKTNRRGLGWDKPHHSAHLNPVSNYASLSSYGHKGFTGTILWVDPEHDLVYVFLSNRIHPDMSNNKLNNFEIRKRIHDAIYESIHNFGQQLN